MAWTRPFHSIKHELDTLCSWHVNLGLSLDAFSHGCLEHTVCGIKHTHGLQLATSKLPITLLLLQALLEQLQQSMSLGAWDQQVTAAAFTVSFACFLRCSEVTWDQASLTQLRVCSITWHEDYAILLLPTSKTDPFRLGTPLVVPKVGGLECPYVVLHLLCPPIRSPDAPLFGLHNSYKPLTCLFFLQHLCSALSCLGLDTSQYARHSFCQGVATWMALQGIDADTIKLLSCWNSECYRQYVDHSAAEHHTIVASALYATRQGPLVPPGASWQDPIL
ncbi:uncharacterized protein UBRO_21032 [Ustilago bromivora]|uniref:Tyr recombinase domain-containing protein n=1 Tax=Ustilago bromivora TaxID=307758 RepID=A0A1K0H527_9BASI|nr:uncharacterized protein UBRO_21032 [Ustilago bromivora]